MSKETGLDVDQVVVSADRYYKRFLAGVSYKPEGSFAGKLLLIRGDCDQILLSEDYDLHKVHQDGLVLYNFITGTVFVFRCAAERWR